MVLLAMLSISTAVKMSWPVLSVTFARELYT
jgi:hypothetical protein